MLDWIKKLFAGKREEILIPEPEIPEEMPEELPEVEELPQEELPEIEEPEEAEPPEIEEPAPIPLPEIEDLELPEDDPDLTPLPAPEVPQIEDFGYDYILGSGMAEVQQAGGGKTINVPQPIDEGELLPEGLVVLFGKPTGAFSSGTTITLDPCDLHGTDNGTANVTPYVQASQASYSMTNSTTIPTTQIVAYYQADDGDYYLLGAPIEIVTDYDVDGASSLLQKKTRNVWILTTGTESANVTVHTGGTCA